jgi:hypothetical protein
LAGVLVSRPEEDVIATSPPFIFIKVIEFGSKGPDIKGAREEMYNSREGYNVFHCGSLRKKLSMSEGKTTLKRKGDFFFFAFFSSTSLL